MKTFPCLFRLLYIFPRSTWFPFPFLANYIKKLIGSSYIMRNHKCKCIVDASTASSSRNHLIITFERRNEWVGGRRGEQCVYESLLWMMDEPFIVCFFRCYSQPKSEFMASTLVASPLWHHPLSYQVAYLFSEIDCKHLQHQMGSVSELFCTT